jgi:hypothetical protein
VAEARGRNSSWAARLDPPRSRPDVHAGPWLGSEHLGVEPQRGGLVSDRNRRTQHSPRHGHTSLDPRQAETHRPTMSQAELGAPGGLQEDPARDRRRSRAVRVFQAARRSARCRVRQGIIQGVRPCITPIPMATGSDHNHGSLQVVHSCVIPPPAAVGSAGVLPELPNEQLGPPQWGACPRCGSADRGRGIRLGLTDSLARLDGGRSTGFGAVHGCSISAETKSGPRRFREASSVVSATLG